MKKQIAALAALVSGVSMNLQTAAAYQGLDSGNSDSGTTRKTTMDFNTKVTSLLAQIIASPEEMQSFKANPKDYLAESGLNAIELDQILFHDNSQPQARTGVTGCRPYSFDPPEDLARTGVTGCRPYTYDAPEALNAAHALAQPAEKLNEQNIRLLEWFERQ